VSTNNDSQPLLTPNNNTPFNNDNVALTSGKDESVNDDDMAHTTNLRDNMALTGGQEVNTPFDNNVAPPSGHDHTVAFDGSPGDDPLHATQASLVNPRVATAATISPDDIFCCLRQILTKLDDRWMRLPLPQASSTGLQPPLIRPLMAASSRQSQPPLKKALNGLLPPLCGKIESLKARLVSSKEDAATLASTLRTEL
jgi:hypothetical protein